MRPFGGEAEWAGDGLDVAYTDSGRSSLRLALRSGLARRHFLLPDFICPVVPELLRQEGVEFSFYPLGEDLLPRLDGVELAPDRVLYLVSYFGRRTPLDGVEPPREMVLMEDNVFSPIFERPPLENPWVGFNSLRKCSPLAEGSELLSTMALDHAAIDPSPAPFVEAKYRAKRVKYAYLHAEEGDLRERDYLALFEHGEAQLEGQRAIHALSRHGVRMLMEFVSGLDGEMAVRRANFRHLARRLASLKLDLEPEYPCFLPIKLERRDDVRRALAEQGIYLPAHWPESGGGNPLHHQLLSIPVDSRYDEQLLHRVAEAVLNEAGG